MVNFSHYFKKNSTPCATLPHFLRYELNVINSTQQSPFVASFACSEVSSLGHLNAFSGSFSSPGGKSKCGPLTHRAAPSVGPGPEVGPPPCAEGTSRAHPSDWRLLGNHTASARRVRHLQRQVELSQCSIIESSYKDTTKRYKVTTNRQKISIKRYKKVTKRNKTITKT